MYYGARYYDPYLNRWTSPDSIVPQPGNPQTLNRYGYALNNPVKYVDPTGHCDQDANRQTDECWLTYGRVIDAFGFNFRGHNYEPVGLSGWNSDALLHLLMWHGRGVEFTSRASEDKVGGPWTGANLQDVVTALDQTENYLLARSNGIFALGLGTGTLTFNKWATTRTDAGGIGGDYQHGDNTINLYLLTGNSPRAVDVAIHEMGHDVDFHIGKGDFASFNSPQWFEATGWSIASNERGGWRGPSGTIVVPNAGKNPAEDFAETFTFGVTAFNHEVYGIPPDSDRFLALIVMLGEAR